MTASVKQREYSRQYRERHPERVREIARNRWDRMTIEERWARLLWKSHKLRPAEYEMLWEQQKGCCYLCGDELERGHVHIDHDHGCCKEGKSCILCRRGLACRGCNWIIGWAGESVEKLRRIADNFESRSLPR